MKRNLDLIGLLATGDFMSLLDGSATNYPYRFYRWELLSP